MMVFGHDKASGVWMYCRADKEHDVRRKKNKGKVKPQPDTITSLLHERVSEKRQAKGRELLQVKVEIETKKSRLFLT